MTKGIEIRDLTIGTGAEATKESVVVANIREFLRRGEEVSHPPLLAMECSIDFRRRDCIAGLLKGIPGMRVGGVREIIISPHLAYGEAGIPGRIPANALLRCVVELIGIRKYNAVLPDDWIPGKILILSHFLEANDNQMNWSLTLYERGNSSLIFFQRLHINQQKNPNVCQIPIQLEADVSERLIRQAMDLPNEMAEDCADWNSGFIDNTGGVVIRDNRTGARCMVVQVMESGKNLCLFGVHEDSRKFLESDFYRTIDQLIRPHLQSDEAEIST